MRRSWMWPGDVHVAVLRAGEITRTVNPGFVARVIVIDFDFTKNAVVVVVVGLYCYLLLVIVIFIWAGMPYKCFAPSSV